MSISAKELAARLQLSAATVSMVFNNKPGISEETRYRVMTAARQYGYVFRNKAPEAPAENRPVQFIIFKNHGSVVGDTSFFTELMEGIVQSCADIGYLAKVSYHYADADFDTQADRNGYRGSAGLILLGTEMEAEHLRAFLALGISTVVLDAYFEEITADYVVINNVQGAFLATDYLARCGHRTIGYLKSSVPISNFSERANGYYNALRRHGIDTSHPYVIPLSPQTEQGYADMGKYLEGRPPLAGAYFADNDIIAAAALRGFARFGYSCPGDVSVIGFDDMPFCELTTPPISTMRVPKRSLGRVAVKRLMEKLQLNEDVSVKISTAVRLIERGSVRKEEP